MSNPREAAVALTIMRACSRRRYTHGFWGTMTVLP